MVRHAWKGLVVGLCLVAVSAAAAPGPPSGAQADQVRSVDDEFVRMGREIPGFGGLFYDEQGRPTVYLLDPEGAGKTALKRLGTEVRIQRGDYEFERLLGWRVELRPMLALPGVVFLDVDETKNRVVIGIDPSRKSLDRDGLEQHLLATSVPRQAVLLQESPRIGPLIGLQDKMRPVPGGVQVVFSGFACTLGFNAVRASVFGFVVASHCTDVFGELEGTRFFQSLPGKANAIGTEIADPDFFTDPPCPPGMRCRYSDTAFAKYDKASLGGLGKIARPASNGSQSGPLTLKTPTARFTIKSRMTSPLVGETVHKVGRTTGWTYGNVLNTCADVNEDVDTTLLCQSLVQIGGGPGDSGAPVFVALSGNTARLVGLLWGGGDDPNLGVVGVFSPLLNIETDLGP
ncbi:MAG TPA: hypothetical protein VGG20_08445, partial [Thermoanaerobaculia bacterium]